MCTWPETLRAARPIVWMSDRPGAQEALLVGVEDRDQRHLRQVEALAQQVDADQHVVLAHPQLAQQLDAAQRVDLGVQVADPDALLQEVVRQVLGHLLGQRGDEHALVLLDAVVDLARAGRRSGPVVGLTTTSGSTRPVGRMICSTTPSEIDSS